MSPLKFEDHVKEKLEKRSITPSANAWGKLEAQLDTQSKYNNKKYSWIVFLVAASITFLIMLSPFFNFSKAKNSVVKTTEEYVPKDNSAPTLTNELEIVKNSNHFDINGNSENQNLKKDKTEKDKTEKDKTEKDKEINHLKIEDKSISLHTKVAINETEKEVTTFSNEALSFQDSQTIFVEDSLVTNKINNKVAELLVQVQGIEKNDIKVTDEEIESLLREAQSEIIKTELLQGDKTNAISLLESVESELDETFKQRVFEALKTSFGKLRTAVAERDN